MKRKNLIVVGVVIVLAVFALFIAKSKLHIGSKPLTSQPAAGPEPGASQGGMAGMPGMAPEKSGGKEAPPQQGEQEEPPTIEISPEKQQLIGVRIATASVRPLEKVIRTVGKIEYDERRLTTVNTKVEGWIEKLYVNFTGVYVKEGERLAELYSPELWATQQEYINLVRWAKNTGKRQTEVVGRAASYPAEDQNMAAMLSKDAENIIAAARQRLKLWDISDDQIKRIEESEKPVRTLTIYSPVSGYVLQKYAVQGQKVMAGEKLFDVSDLSAVWVMADIYEYELPLIKVGETAKIKLSYFPGKEFASQIDFVTPTLSSETRTVKARFSIPNPGGQLKPQMFSDVELRIDLGKKLAVPDDAVIDTGLRQVVYVDKGNGIFEPREVRVGIRAEKLVEVTDGVKAGEKVASSANFLIDSEAKLKGVAPLSLPGRKPAEGPKQGPAPAHRHGG